MITPEQCEHLKKIKRTHAKIARQQSALISSRAEMAILLREGEQMGCTQSMMARAAGLTPGRVSQVTKEDR